VLTLRSKAQPELPLPLHLHAIRPEIGCTTVARLGDHAGGHEVGRPVAPGRPYRMRKASKTRLIAAEHHVLRRPALDELRLDRRLQSIGPARPNLASLHAEREGHELPRPEQVEHHRHRVADDPRKANRVGITVRHRRDGPPGDGGKLPGGIDLFADVSKPPFCRQGSDEVA